MKLINILLKIAGKENIQLDSRISNGYIFKLCCKYSCMLIRGLFFSFFNNKISSPIFIGKHVKVLEKQNLYVGEKTKIHDDVYINALSIDGVYLGNNVVIGSNCRLECTGSIEYIGKGIKIGDYSSFGRECYFGAAGGIEIGCNVIAGQNIRFHSENHNFNNLDILIREQGVNHKGIKVGDNCWIGAGAIFLDGAQLGDGCVVASNAVITKQFENNSVIAGVPARVIKYRGK